jgi:hypothetical protein
MGHIVPDILMFTMPSNARKTEKTVMYDERKQKTEGMLVAVAISPTGRSGEAKEYSAAFQS